MSLLCDLGVAMWRCYVTVVLLGVVAKQPRRCYVSPGVARVDCSSCASRHLRHHPRWLQLLQLLGYSGAASANYFNLKQLYVRTTAVDNL